MRNLSDLEVVNLTKIVQLEYDGLAVARSMKEMILDDDLKKQYESIVLNTEGRLKGLLQFINENNVLEHKEDLVNGQDIRNDD